MESNGTRDEEAPLVVHDGSPPPSSHPLNHARDVHILSCGFLLVFSAYGAAQNLQSTINTTDNLGTISLGIVYVSFTFFSFIASLVVRGIGAKNAVILGSTGYWLFVAANLKPSWYTMVPASLYLGFTASVIWVGQGTYLTSTARSHAKDHNLHEGTVIGSFNGEFWMMFASQQFVGNLVSLALLNDDGVGSTSGTTLLFTVFLGSMTMGTILMFFMSKRDTDIKDDKALRERHASFCSSVLSLLGKAVNLLFDRRMLLIIPLIAYSGLQQAFVWAEFTRDVVKPALGESGVGGSMAVYGAADAICSFAAGRLTSGLTSITWIVTGGVLLQVCAYVWLLVTHSFSGIFQIICPLILAVMLGIGDGVMNTQLSTLLALLFKSDTEGAFAQLKVWQSASIAAVSFLSPYISFEAMLAVILSAAGLSLCGFFHLTLHVEKAFSSSSS